MVADYSSITNFNSIYGMNPLGIVHNVLSAKPLGVSAGHRGLGAQRGAAVGRLRVRGEPTTRA